MIRVILPAHLRILARVSGEEVRVPVEDVATVETVLDSLEAHYPMLRGTLRDHLTHRRRAFVRFFACEQDWSHEPLDKPLPDVIANAQEPLLIVGALAGG